MSTIDLRHHLAVVAAERDAYAAEARALREQAAAGHAREIFLHESIAQLRTILAAEERRAAELADALAHARMPTVASDSRCSPHQT